MDQSAAIPQANRTQLFLLLSFFLVRQERVSVFGLCRRGVNTSRLASSYTRYFFCHYTEHKMLQTFISFTALKINMHLRAGGGGSHGVI